MKYDVLIIGAGVVGTATARELARLQLKIAVLEKSSGPARGTSKANSGIIHAGYDAKPGTLIAKFNIAGHALFKNLAKELSVTYKEIGSLVVALEGQGTSELQRLYSQGQANGVKGLRLIDRNELLTLEPNISPSSQAALFAPTAAIVAPYELTQALAQSAAQNGVEFMFNQQVTAISATAHGFLVTTPHGTYSAKIIINAAGVYADHITQLIGDDSFAITAVKGEEAILDKKVGGLVKHIIFPLPSPESKGIIVSPTAHGNLLIGPTAVPTQSQDDTSTTALGLRNILSGAQALVPSLPTNSVITAYAGLRAVATTGDFIIGPSHVNPNFLQAAGIKSPGLTAAPAIAKHLADLVCERLQPAVNTAFNPILLAQPRASELTPEEWHNLIQHDLRYGQVICRCEQVTAGEICHCLNDPLPPQTLDDLKQRTRAGMGRCSGGFCTPIILELLENEIETKQ